MAQAFLHASRTRQTANRTIADMMAITPELSDLSTQALRSITSQVVSNRPSSEQQAEQMTRQAFLQHLQATNPNLASIAAERMNAKKVPSGETERSRSGAGHNHIPAQRVPSGETERSRSGAGHNHIPAQRVPSGETEVSPADPKEKKQKDNSK